MTDSRAHLDVRNARQYPVLFIVFLSFFLFFFLTNAPVILYQVNSLRVLSAFSSVDTTVSGTWYRKFVDNL